MWSYSENIWPNAQRNWPNARAFDELRTHFVTVGRIDQMRCALGKSAVAQLVKCRAFDQLVKCSARLPKCADWSNALYNSTLMHPGPLYLQMVSSAPCSQAQLQPCVCWMAGKPTRGTALDVPTTNSPWHRLWLLTSW